MEVRIGIPIERRRKRVGYRGWQLWTVRESVNRIVVAVYTGKHLAETCEDNVRMPVGMAPEIQRIQEKTTENGAISASGTYLPQLQ
jgi:hypothetical protein